MKKRLLAALIALAGGMPEIKVSAKDKRSMKDRRPHTPPRSMTEAEQVYYNRNKNLNGFYK